MSRQIQIRRGTTAQHQNFTGALGEITMDTDAKTLRVHDGQTVGGFPLARADQINTIAQMSLGTDAVVGTFKDDNSWYRQYASGWIEQGGVIHLSAENTPVHVRLPIEMYDRQYTIHITAVGSSGASASVCVTELGTTSFQATSTAPTDLYWEVKGIHAA